MTDDEMQLRNVDPEDIEDMLPIIERSFGVKFTQAHVDGVITFGQLCDMVERTIDLPHEDGCTSQQAFYKLREAILSVQGINPSTLIPAAKLEDVFPRKNRRLAIKQMEQSLGFPLEILKPKAWVVNFLLIGFIIALVSLFFFVVAGQVAIMVLVVCTLLANHFGNELKLVTLGDSAAYIAREHYRLARRNNFTINKWEVAAKIKELFMDRLSVPAHWLTREATFV